MCDIRVILTFPLPQEGSGPCLFCGTIICTPEEEEWLVKDSKKGKKFKEQFLKKFNLEVRGEIVCFCNRLHRNQQRVASVSNLRPIACH